MKKNLILTMSGGTTSVINATLAGIVNQCQKYKYIDRVFAGFPGIEGVMKNNIVDLTELNNEKLKLLAETPGSGFVGTSRVKLLNNIELKKIEEVFQKHKINYFVNIGGNGTIKQTKAIANYFDSKINVA